MGGEPGMMLHGVHSRVAARLGLPDEAGHGLLLGLRARNRLHTVRLAGFLLATSRAGRVLLPGLVRDRAIDALVFPLLREHSDVLVVVGLAERSASRCSGLAPPRP